MYLATSLFGGKDRGWQFHIASHGNAKSYDYVFLFILPALCRHESATLQGTFFSLISEKFSLTIANSKIYFFFVNQCIRSIKSALQLSSRESTLNLTIWYHSPLMLYIMSLSKVPSKECSWPKLQHNSAHVP